MESPHWSSTSSTKPAEARMIVDQTPIWIKSIRSSTKCYCTPFYYLIAVKISELLNHFLNIQYLGGFLFTLQPLNSAYMGCVFILFGWSERSDIFFIAPSTSCVMKKLPQCPRQLIRMRIYAHLHTCNEKRNARWYWKLQKN